MVTATTGMTEKEIARIIRTQVCAECGDILKRSMDDNCRTVIVCARFANHQGIAKRYEPRDLTFEARREEMVTEHGEVKTQALERYAGLTSLTKPQAQEIIDTIWPGASKASAAEVYKAVSICVQYGLNPLMRHLYLIPFSGKYVTVLGIGANRLIASRKHSYSYVDDTPRLMSEEEQKRIFGVVDKANTVAITILKDTKTGAVGRGYGKWPNDKKVQGEDKGNSPANMAFIRSERQALDRLYPADLPHDVGVIDEQYQPAVTNVTVDELVTEAIEAPSESKDTAQVTEAAQAQTATCGSPAETGVVGEKKTVQYKRDPASITTIEQLAKALKEDYQLTYQQQWKELNITSWRELSIKPAEAYIQVAAARH